MLPNKVNPNSRLFVQDGDPSQNSRPSAKKIKKPGVQQISILPRSPGLNPIENVFHLIGQKLKRDFFSIMITIYIDSLITNKLKIKVNKIRQDRTQNLQKTYTACCNLCTLSGHKNIKYI